MRRRAIFSSAAPKNVSQFTCSYVNMEKSDRFNDPIFEYSSFQLAKNWYYYKN